MTFTRDEQILMMLYGDGTKQGLEQGLRTMKAQLQPDETELLTMTDNLLRKLKELSEDAFWTLKGNGMGGMDGE